MNIKFLAAGHGCSIRIIKVGGYWAGTVGRKGDIRRYGFLPLLEVEPGTEDDWFVMMNNDGPKTFNSSAEARNYIERKCEELYTD